MRNILIVIFLMILFITILTPGCKGEEEVVEEEGITEAGGMFILTYLHMESSILTTNTLSIELKFFETQEDFSGYFGFYPLKIDSCEKIEYEDFDRFMEENFDLDYIDAGSYARVSNGRDDIYIERENVERGPLYRISLSGQEAIEFLREDGYYSVEVEGTTEGIEGFFIEEGVHTFEKVELMSPGYESLEDLRGEDIHIEWKPGNGETFLINIYSTSDKQIVCNVEDDGEFIIDEEYTSLFTPSSLSLLRIDLSIHDIPHHSPLWSYGIVQKQILSD